MCGTVAQWSMFVIGGALTYLQFSGNVPLLHTSTKCPGTSLHVINFTRPSPALVRQATNAGAVSPGYEATQRIQVSSNRLVAEMCGGTRNSLVS